MADREDSKGGDRAELSAAETRMAALMEAAAHTAALCGLLGAADEYGLQPGLCNAGDLLAQRGLSLLNGVIQIDDPELDRANFALHAAQEALCLGASNDQGEDAPGESGIGYALASVLAERLEDAETLIVRVTERESLAPVAAAV